MKRSKSIVAAILLLVSGKAVYALSPLCNGSCIECREFYPLIEKMASDLREEYLRAESDVSSRYNSEIMPVLEDRKTLLLQYDKLVAELKAINAAIAIRSKQLIKEKERR